MIDVEIPEGAQTFFEGNFYKFNGDRLFYFLRGEWRISPVDKYRVRQHIRKTPSILTSIQDAMSAWDKNDG